MRRTILIATLTVLIAAGFTPTQSFAQDQRLRVSLGTATTAGAIDSELAVAASVGYRFAELFSFEVEITGIDAPADRFSNQSFALGATGMSGAGRFGSILRGAPGFGGQLGMGGSFIGVPGGFNLPQGVTSVDVGRFSGSTEGQTLLATLGFRMELPVQGGRLKPYVNAGLGVARTDEEFRLSPPPMFGSIEWRSMGTFQGQGGDNSASHTGLAGSLGLGASFRVYKELSLDVDARYFRLDRDRNLGRLGGGLSYRF
jgi:opacity protein-like surface antigen